MKRLTHLIDARIERLAPIPPIAHQVLQMAADPATHASELAELIQMDTAITASTLRICNSAYFGLAVQVDSIRHAINLLGMDQLVELVLVRHIAGTPDRCDAADGSDPIRAWKQAVAAALLARQLAGAAGMADLPLLFTAALLRDVGQTVLDDIDGDARTALRRLIDIEGRDRLEAERAVFGVDHAVLGERITESWNFSGKMTHIIRYHHDPLQGIHADRDTALVYLADLVSRIDASAPNHPPIDSTLYHRVLVMLAFSGYDLYRLLADYRRHFAKAEMMLANL